MQKWIAACIALLLALPVFAFAGIDFEGNTDDPGNPHGDSPGDPCGTCPDPASSIRGVTFRDGDLWVLSSSNRTIYHLDNCTVIETVIIQAAGSYFGLGYDSSRDLFVVTDASADVVKQVAMNGTVVNTWPSPGSGPVGAAYDTNRDLYWITDFNVGAITSIDPNTGSPGPTTFVPAGSRLAGTGYNPGLDALFYNGRDQAMSYVISAMTGAFLYSFPVPGGGGNNGQGTGVAPDGNGWLAHFEQPTLFCVEIGGGVPVETSTWGAVKSLYH